MCSTRRYASYLPAKAPQLMVQPMPMEGSVYDYQFVKNKLK